MRSCLGRPAEAGHRCGAHIDQRPDQIEARSLNGKLGQIIATLFVYCEATGTCYSCVIPVLEAPIDDDGEGGANAKGPEGRSLAGL